MQDLHLQIDHCGDWLWSRIEAGIGEAEQDERREGELDNHVPGGREEGEVEIEMLG